MKKIEWTKESLQSYIDNKTEENLTLEYKGKDALVQKDSVKTEISKDVSSFANSTGGSIIYGISEKDHLPLGFDYINSKQFNKEWLENVILSRVHPKIDGLQIHLIKADLSNPYNVVYIIEIPQSSTAHQASDYRYYKRHNFQAVPMEDYEIRDIMGRSKYPLLVPFFWHIGDFNNPSDHLYLQVKVRNKGIIAAKSFAVEIALPTSLGVKATGFNSPNDNKVRENNSKIKFRILRFRSSFTIDNPVLFPGDEYHLLDQNRRYVEIGKDTEVINNFSLTWRVFADDAPLKEGSIELKYIYSSLNEANAEIVQTAIEEGKT